MKGVYRGVFDCFIKIYKFEKPKSYFKGNMMNVFRIYSQQSFTFIFNRYLTEQFFPTNSDQNRIQSLIKKITTAIMSSSTGLLIYYPFDLIRTR